MVPCDISFSQAAGGIAGNDEVVLRAGTVRFSENVAKEPGQEPCWCPVSQRPRSQRRP